jgi:KUP system potassium uptake protein
VAHGDIVKAPAGATALVVGSLGVVYGDLGTSPLYSIREAFVGRTHRLAVDRLNVLGAVSIILWTLTLIIAVKYVLLVLRADNNGEGGILALTALVGGRDSERRSRIRTGGLVLLGLFGTALLFGDGMITPAISVLSAVEGLEVVHPGLESAIVPLAIVILILLFAIQRFGTGGVGRVFGPIMVIWFGVLAVLGTVSVIRTPEIIQSVNPVHAVRYFAHNGTKGFLSMGSLFLVVTGGEALYADMGHFGRRPITSGWFIVVMPALVATYLGIGALLLRDPAAIRSPFFLIAPDSLQLPVVILATAATVIASQALISGVFSLTSQAVQLGFAPVTRIVYTSPTVRGQIYVPLINWGLMVACVGLVIAFRSSGRLAAAFGLSVTGTMFITTILFAVYAHRRWKWNPVVTGLVAGVILVVEGAFLLANAFKIPSGGWFPLLVGVVILLLFTTWKTGRVLVAEQIRASRTPLRTFIASCSAGSVVRVAGTAVFLHSQRGTTPPSMAALVRTTGTLHEHVYVVSIVIDETPRVHPSRRVDANDLTNGVYEATLHYGFMEETYVADDLETHLQIRPQSTDYILGRETVRSTSRPGMARWREVLYGLMVRNASDVATSFNLPADRVFEVGTRVEI